MGIVLNLVSSAAQTMTELLTLLGGQILAVLVTVIAVLTLALGGRK